MSLRLSIAVLFCAAGCFAAPGPDDHNKIGTLGDDPSQFRVGNRLEDNGVTDAFYDEVQPVLAQRCATCHGCSDSPCQLKLTSFEAVARGANEKNLFNPRPFYDTPREHRLSHYRHLDDEGLVDMNWTTRLWRTAGYYSVTDGGEQSIMHQLLSAAHNAPIASRDLTPARDLAAEVLPSRSFQCVGDQPLSAVNLAARAMPMGFGGVEPRRPRRAHRMARRRRPGTQPRGSTRTAKAVQS